MVFSRDTKHRVILDESESWDSWLSTIKASVFDEDIWNLINPEIRYKPETSARPAEPPRPEPHHATGLINVEEAEQYRILSIFRQQDMRKFKDEIKELRAVNSLISETISARVANLIAYADPDPWSRLVALKQRLEPTNKARSFMVKKRYHQLAEGPTNQNVNAWLNEWTEMHHEASRMRIAEVSENGGIRDFLLAIENIDPLYATTRERALSAIAEQNEELGEDRQVRQRTMDEEVERFRNYRLHQTSFAVRDSHTSFTTAKPTFKGKGQKGKTSPPMCICGEKMWYSECPYLVRTNAPTGWKEDPAVRQKVNKALEDSKIEAQVRKNLENRAKRAQTAQKSQRTSFTTAINPAALTTTISHESLAAHSGTAANTPSIESYLILDAVSNVHVCNRKSAHLYTKIRDAESREYMYSGFGMIKVESWGVMETAFETPNDLISILLQNVAFAGSFVTSLVSQSVLKSKGLNFDISGPHLYRGKGVEYLLHRNGGHYTFSAAGPPHPYPQGADKWQSNQYTTNLTVTAIKAMNIKPANESHNTKAIRIKPLNKRQVADSTSKDEAPYHITEGMRTARFGLRADDDDDDDDADNLLSRFLDSPFIPASSRISTSASQLDTPATPPPETTATGQK